MPIFMHCCRKTACKRCVLQEMTKEYIDDPEDDEEILITSGFKCSLC